MVFFNDPLPCADAPERAVRMAIAMRERVAQLALGWSRRGYDLAFGVGIAQGHATLGRIGFEGRSDYAAIGTVTNLAARLCAEAGPGQILVSQRVHTATAAIAIADPVGQLELRGFSRPPHGLQHHRSRGRAGRGMTAAANGGPRLSDLSEEQRSARFARLQERLDAGLAGDAARPAG